MKVQFELVVGENKFTLIEDVETHADFFKKLHFYATLPKVGPNGETDLVLTYRVAQKQYEYYSIVSQKAKQEFKFGQSKESKGMLFAKGWEPLYEGDRTEETTTDTTATTTRATGLGGPTPTVSTAVNQNVAMRTGLGTAPTPAPTPAPATAAQTATQVKASAVLAKFGIAG